MSLSLVLLSLLAAQDPEKPSYSKVHELFLKHCVGCHNKTERKGDLVLESFAELLKGGESGEVLVPGKPGESLILDLVEHKKKPAMPPPKKGQKLKPEEVAVLRAWIGAGAPGPKPGEVLPAAALPRIAPKVAPRKSIYAAAYEPKAKLLALGRHGEVEIRSAETRAVVRTLPGPAGNVNDLAFSADGTKLAAGGGEPGRGGEVHLWNVADGRLLRAFKGHADAIYAVALSADGKLLATGSYDQKILLWDLGAEAPLRACEGHSGAVFDVAFRTDGKILASASYDRTVKLWDVATGQRLDTLSESTKPLHAIAFSPDGKAVAAAGVDNRIRAWSVSADAREGTNPIRYSAFAHEGTILRLAWSADGKTLLSSADDRTVKLFAAADGAQKRVLEAQPDWPAGLAFALGDKAVAVGRLDGSFEIYDAATAKAIAPPKPELAALEPRGLRRGTSVPVKLTGRNLAALSAVKSSHAKLSAELLPGAKEGAAWAQIAGAKDLPPGTYELWVAGPGGESGRLALYVEDLPQVAEAEPNDAVRNAQWVETPASLWGVLESPGDADHFAFQAARGQTLVLDLAARRIGSKADFVVTLSDAFGRTLSSNIDFEGETDPLLAFRIPADGTYLARVADLEARGSNDHFYRLSVGPLPVVTGCYPLGVPANEETEVRLVGHNLPPGAAVRVKAGAPGDVGLAIDPERFRARRGLSVVAGTGAEVVEAEPNDRPEQGGRVPVGGAASGRFDRPGDADCFRFEAKAGQALVLETLAARRSSPVDTRIEILSSDGRPVPRVLLRAVRDSYVTFRPIDSNANGVRLPNWEEMDLNQYLYLQGEVVKLFLAPRGPDSEWNFYGLGGKRLTYFGTSPTAHALDEPCYIVEPHPPGTRLAANGLPSFLVHYENDDDPLRQLGSDSRLDFTAPADGTYVARVTDVRGFGGDRNVYRLVVREARPDFRVRIDPVNQTIPRGSGRNFTVHVDREDGFDGPVEVEIAGAPPGFTITSPILVEGGHFEAKGTIFAAADAPKPPGAAGTRLTARATVRGKAVVKEAGTLGTLSVGEAPKVLVTLTPVERNGSDEIAVVPGKLVPAWLRIERRGFDGRVQFDVENLPHGVIVADIGLNGVLIPEGQAERKIFLQCQPWVAETRRLCYARAREVGNPTSRPVVLKVAR